MTAVTWIALALAVVALYVLAHLTGVLHRHRWSRWSEPQSELVDAIAAFGGRPFSAERLPDGWYQWRICSVCNKNQREDL